MPIVLHFLSSAWELLKKVPLKVWLVIALLIGVLGGKDNIDPVIVSSCIITDDERSETQAAGIVNKVR